MLLLLFLSADAGADHDGTVYVRYRQNTTSTKSMMFVWRANSGSAWERTSGIGGEITAGSNNGPNGNGFTRPAGSHLGVMYGDCCVETNANTLLTLETDGATYYVVPTNTTVTTPYFEILPTVTVSAVDGLAVESSNSPPLSSEIGKFRISRTGSTSSSLTVYYTAAARLVFAALHLISLCGIPAPTTRAAPP